MPNATAGLLRVSTADQSVAAQRDQIERWAAANGIDPVAIDWRLEEGVSGAATARPIAEGVLHDAREGRVATLVVVALDRLGRSAARVLAALDEYHRLGVRVVSLREGVDLASPTGRLVAGIFASLAEFERVLIADRTRAGLAAARRRGARLGRPSFEWRPEEVEELRALRHAGHSLSEIRERALFRVFDAKGRARVPSERSMRRALAAR